MFKASINWLHFGVLRLHVAEEMVAPRPDCATPKMSSKVVRQHQNAGPKMRPFSEPGKEASTQRHQKRVRIPGPFLRPLLTLFLNSQLQKSDHRFSFCLRCHSIQRHSFLSCCNSWTTTATMFCGLQSNKCRKRYSRNCTVGAAFQLDCLKRIRVQGKH